MDINDINGFSEFDEPETEVEVQVNQSHGVAKQTENLNPELWGQFCFDIIMNHDELALVLQSYNVAEPEFLQLLDNKVFSDRLKDAQLQIKTLGPSAGFVLAARAQAEKHLVTLGRIADNNLTHPAVRVKAIENMVRYAHLDPQTQKQVKDSEQRSGSPGVLVQFNIGGGLLGGGTKVIQVQAEQVPEVTP